MEPTLTWEMRTGKLLWTRPGREGTLRWWLYCSPLVSNTVNYPVLLLPLLLSGTQRWRKSLLILWRKMATPVKTCTAKYGLSQRETSLCTVLILKKSAGRFLFVDEVCHFLARWQFTADEQLMRAECKQKAESLSYNWETSLITKFLIKLFFLTEVLIVLLNLPQQMLMVTLDSVCQHWHKLRTKRQPALNIMALYNNYSQK